MSKKELSSSANTLNINPENITWEGYERFENYEGKVQSREMSSLISYLEGQMLTIVDAVFPEGSQRESVKSLVKRNIWETYEEIQRGLFQKHKGVVKYPLV
jgi:hypothetical protein